MIEVKLTFIDCDIKQLNAALEQAMRMDKNLILRLKSMELESDCMRIVNEYKQEIGEMI